MSAKSSDTIGDASDPDDEVYDAPKKKPPTARKPSNLMIPPPANTVSVKTKVS